jgi:hypothetical protein
VFEPTETKRDSLPPFIRRGSDELKHTICLILYVLCGRPCNHARFTHVGLRTAVPLWLRVRWIIRGMCLHSFIAHFLTARITLHPTSPPWISGTYEGQTTIAGDRFALRCIMHIVSFLYIASFFTYHLGCALERWLNQTSGPVHVSLSSPARFCFIFVWAA